MLTTVPSNPTGGRSVDDSELKCVTQLFHHRPTPLLPSPDPAWMGVGLFSSFLAGRGSLSAEAVLQIQ